MIKIDKNTHMFILLTFSIVFVSVYLYYTIIDVRKMQQDIKNSEVQSKSLSQQIEQLKAILGTQQSGNVVTPSVTVPTVQVQVSRQHVHVPEKQVVEVNEIVDELDDESVTTEDIRNTLHCESDDDSEVDDVAQDCVVQQEVSQNDTEQDDDVEITFASEQDAQQSITPEEIKSLKYEELRDLCRTYNISQKGNKDVLIKKLTEHIMQQ